MTKYNADWVTAEQKKRAWVAQNGLYSEAEEHASCGVGLVVSIDGTPSRKVVEHGIAALKAIWHRGAVDADGKTGDGAGIHIDIPVGFFQDQIRRTGHEPRANELLAVGQVFLPRHDFAAQEICRTIVETEVLRMGYYIFGWRHVPVDVACLGEKANATRPEIEQILISNSKGVDKDTFERELYLIRRRIEKASRKAGVSEFYIASLSCRSIIYKGMMLAEQVAVFYPDLMDPRFKSAFAIYHQRYSTNTFPQWWLAQPFRMLAHNGEVNTLKGNINWMKSHEIRMASAEFGVMAEDIKPIVPNGSSDSAALDVVFEMLVRAGRNAPVAKTMLIPESWSKQAIELPDTWRDMYSYCNSVIEPWDGPAALAMTDGRWVCAGLDRNGLRPMRYVVTEDGLLIAGSEAGMVSIDETDVRKKGALGPGQLLSVDMQEGRLYHDTEIKDKLAASQPFGEWVGRITELDSALTKVTEKPLFMGSELRKRQIAAGYSIEELEQILAPMAEDGKETLASMGDDTPSAVLSKTYRPLSHFFRQNFSQVTNPPIDSMREYRVMSLKTRFGNLKNVLDESSAQTEILALDSPFVGNAQWQELTPHFNADLAEIDCSFAVDGGTNALQEGLDRIRAEAEDAVRSGAGHLVLTDHHSGVEKVAMPMILATSAVHSHLTSKGLRTFCSLNVRAAECIDPHYFSVLIGARATVVNAYLAEDSLAQRIERGLLDGLLTEVVNLITLYAQEVREILASIGAQSLN
ncbi:MAG: glutamate synthase central domain-containing protein, partial [Paracoccaceae bacterium]|nr:glutamate synthase central domain-containing protein [Paracoccaceae bacterium]